MSPTEAGPLAADGLFTQGRAFGRCDPILSTTVFHWFTPTEGNVSGPWEPLEGRANWTGEKQWWTGQIKQMMLAGFDIIYLHLISRFEQQRINFFAAIRELRSRGYDVPKIAPFLDPFGIWPPETIDISKKTGKNEFASHYIRFFEQFFQTNTDPLAETYLARIDNRVVLATWWVTYILNNLDSFRKADVESRLRKALGDRSSIFGDGIYMVTTALVDPDLPFSDERTVFFSGLSYCVHAVHNDIHSYHLQGGYWDQNIRRPGLFLPRNGGRVYKNVWQYVLKQCEPRHRIYVESWNEYDEGSGIYAAKPGPPFNPPELPPENTDRWSETDDPLEYVRTTAEGAAEFNGLPAHDAKILAHDVSPAMSPGQTASATVVVRNEGNALWSGRERFALAQKEDSPELSFESGRCEIDAAANETELYGGVFRGRPVTFTINFSAPASPGSYRMKWGMVHGDDDWFGEELEVQIDVH